MSDQAPQQGRPQPQQEQGQPQQIDIRLLAEKVYRLMLSELRIEQSRSGFTTPRGKR